MLQFPVTPAKDLVLATEDIDEFNQLRAGLHAQYSAATPTELFLVEELVQNAWRIRRFRIFEADAFQTSASGVRADMRQVAFLQRSLASAERAYHRALAALTKLQRDRTRQTPVQKPAAAVNPTPKSGFVPQKSSPSIAEELGIDQSEFERLKAIREKVHAGVARARSES